MLFPFAAIVAHISLREPLEAPHGSRLQCLCRCFVLRYEICCAWQVLALARKMLDGRSKQDILDSSYHRYAFHDTGVPKWFYEDEKRHMRRVPSLPPSSPPN